MIIQIIKDKINKIYKKKVYFFDYYHLQVCSQ